MTEAQWLACGDPQPMLDFLRYKASNRKLRLFGCACCRRIWQVLHDERSRMVVEAAERVVDGEADKNELQRAALQAKTVSDELYVKAGSDDTPTFKARYYAAAAAHLLTLKVDPRGPQDWAAAAALFGLGSTKATHEAAQAFLLRCIAGNPFRPVASDPAWQTPSVVALAHAAYVERILPSGDLDLIRLAVFSDALEEAGCADADILLHLRSPGPHVRGCWALDLILGKE